MVDRLEYKEVDFSFQTDMGRKEFQAAKIAQDKYRKFMNSQKVVYGLTTEGPWFGKKNANHKFKAVVLQIEVLA